MRAAVRNAARNYGGNDVLANVMGIPVDTLYAVLSKKKHRASGTFAIRLAQAGGMSVEALLSGSLNAAGRCETCGSRIGHGVTARAAGGAQ